MQNFKKNQEKAEQVHRRAQEEERLRRGEITQAEDVNPISHAINKYWRGLKWSMNPANGEVPSGIYTLPMIALTAVGAGSLPLVTTLTTASGAAAGGAAVNGVSNLLTGNSFGENFHNLTGIDSDLSEFFNPGAFYGGWVGNNFGNLGRYTLNYLDPRGYGNYFARLKDVYTKPFYTKPPTFYNGRKPAWYGNQGFFNDDEIRFQNGAIWAGIPEEEVPRTLIQKNVDGTYRFTRGAIENAEKSTKIPFEDMAGLKDKDVLSKISEGQSITEQDWLTSVGGEHSDYILRQNNPRSLVWEFRDEQKLNPQYQVADWIKKHILHVPSETKVPWLDKFGGADLSWLLGYKPFTYRQGILLDKNSNFRLFYDPAHAEKYGLSQTLIE